jgi:NAD(P)H-hydrate epimerase
MYGNRITAMVKTVTAAEMKALDAYTINAMGVPSMVLMERAAMASAEVLYEKHFNLKKVLCICGSGNNGGDGLAIARLLRIKGVTVEAVLIGDVTKMSSETKQQMEIARNYDVPVIDNELSVIGDGCTTIVDALFGIGGGRPLAGKYYDAVGRINESPAEVLAIDIPSGICVDTGEVLGIAVRARVTATFAFNKIGLTVPPGSDYAGEVVVKDIGIYER